MLGLVDMANTSPSVEGGNHEAILYTINNALTA